ncbi:carboxyl transferase domain-containing protein [Phenylobacterium soli]|uniref:Carbamoyl-phosphate synthase large subunit n=1 Tax=Phenylobacterium soli TaxID=2170551 RepID=A0A328AF03_9CAUL|nr:carboxyl transferase domain-containing protein [Phenylobacterium soli]RAK53115.1 carbamoyl-phosphate synthase large subunit [Phenylobacterium soli]
MKKLLIANRGEIAVRIARTAAEMGLATVAIHSEDDAASLHIKKADEAVALKGAGPAAYLDIDQIIAAARAAGCDAVHPGYGFLSENPAFARACAAAGLTFVGPSPETLDLFGDKGRARQLATDADVPVLPGTQGATSLAEAKAFLAALGAGRAVMVKAVAGGGGRGMRPAASEAELEQAFERCASEAKAAFGDDALYVEQFLPRARHVEVQILGDGVRVSHLWDRECSLQRQRQKVIEIAPADSLPEALRAELFAAAVRLGEAAAYRGLGTMEFLVDAEHPNDGPGRFVFIEGNARLQVEHTVTEEITGLDLVRIQLQLAAGRSLAELGLEQAHIPAPRGHAVQVRVNLETMADDGSARPAGGVLSVFEPPSGPGVRVDHFGYAGYTTSARFDSLLAKLIVHAGAGGLSRAVAKAYRALSEFRIEGSETNIAFLQNLLALPAVAAGDVHTRFIEEHMGALAHPPEAHPRLYFDAAARGSAAAGRAAEPEAPAGTTPLRAPLQGTVIGLQVQPGDTVRKGQAMMIMEAMKMEHVIAAEAAGVVRAIAVQPGDTVFEGHPLAFVEEAAEQEVVGEAEAAIDLDAIRPDLAEVIERHRLTLDAARPDAVARRRKTGQRTARENLDDLFDPGTFSEVGAMAVAAQRRRRSLEDLRVNTPADGIVVGVGEVNGALFDEDRARCVGLAYDFTVLAGTQGHFNHKKTDRILEFAEHWKAPIVWYTEGGGGRPGDVDGGQLSASSLDTTSFTTFARLSGLAPRIAINSGRCFAGNAVFFGCADVTIATRYSNIGLGGPAMIEGGGLGVFTPDEIGPSDVQYANGALDLLVEDEAQATAAAKQILGVFQGAVKDWACEDQRRLRHLIPENRVRAYDVREVIRTLADTGTWIELRGGYGKGMITGFLRIEGRPMGLIANDPRHLGGAIDSEGAEKGGRFLQLCDAFDVPVLSLCDTPGFMVGPQSETTAAIRRGSRLFVTATSLTVPFFTVVLRKGYGLGAQAMAAGDFSAPAMTVAWPTAEFGPMGLEGAVRLGYRKELEAEQDPAARQALFEKLVGRMYETGKALSVASVVEIDAVIDPAETRAWLVRGLKACPVPPKVRGKKRPFVDVW